jgi:ectoine hydroxylase-related dioxygenase (phytanoyl-CoA dioxygenase family)
MNQKYITTKNNLRNTIDKYGVAIIENVLDNTEIDAMRTGMWDYLEHITQNFNKHIKRDDKDSWKEYSKLYPKHSMLLQNWGIGHAQFIWDLRQNEKVIDIFANLWNCENKDLLVSFDGASFHFPPEITKKGWYRGNLWYHTDQSYTRNGFECVQSWVTAYDVNKDDATLAFLESSHKYHSDFAKKYDIKDKSDWYKHTDKELEFYFNDKNCIEGRITCKAGSMVFWDSRTIHCGTEPVKTRDNKNTRNVAYICMMPRQLSTNALIRKKQKAFEDLRTTNHWANKPKLFPKLPRTYGGPIPNVVDIEAPLLTNEGLKLAGF